VLAQWAPDPLVLPYLPHLVIGVAAAIMIWRAPEGVPRPSAEAPPETIGPAGWPPAAVRTWRFWLAVAPASPMVFGSVALAIVVLPEDVTSARTLSAGFAGLMTALAFAAGVGIQPVARRLGNPLAGNVVGLCCAAAGAGIGAAAVAGADRILAGLAAVLLGLAYGLCLVSGLRQAEQMAGPRQRGAVVACYYALAYLGFAAPYLAAGLGAVSSQATAFGVLAGTAIVIAAWTAGYGLRLSRSAHAPYRQVRTSPCLESSDANLGRSGARLAGRAPEGDPVLLSFGADGRAAAPARTAGPPVYPGLLAAAPVAGGDLADPVFVRVQQAAREFGHRPEVRDGAGRLPRVDAAQEQHLGLIQVADAGQAALIEQRLADGAARFGGQPPYRFGAIPVRAEQIWPQVPGDLILVAGANQLDHAELITDRLPGIVGEHQPDLVAVLDLLGGPPDSPAAVHAEMSVDGEAVLGPGQQVLAARGGLDNHLTGQVGGG
jgi:hypothetical protein